VPHWHWLATRGYSIAADAPPSALTTIRNAYFHVSGRCKVANFQSPHDRHRRVPSTKAAYRKRGPQLLHVRVPQRCAQFPLAMPTCPVRPLRGRMRGIGPPRSHVQAVVSTAFFQQRAAQTFGCGCPRVPSSRKLSHPHRSFNPAVARKYVSRTPRRTCARLAEVYCYPSTMALRLLCVTLNDHTHSSDSF
jgi:hypothetical protein